MAARRAPKSRRKQAAQRYDSKDDSKEARFHFRPRCQRSRLSVVSYQLSGVSYQLLACGPLRAAAMKFPPRATLLIRRSIAHRCRPHIQ
jgi:hypothetical protein